MLEGEGGKRVIDPKGLDVEREPLENQSAFLLMTLQCVFQRLFPHYVSSCFSEIPTSNYFWDRAIACSNRVLLAVISDIPGIRS